MSGGAWGYLGFKLEDSRDKVAATLDLMVHMEHELDWGVSGDTCQKCAELRVIGALYKFFEDGANYTKEVRTILTEHWSNEEFMCPDHIEWKREHEVGTKS